MEDAEKLTEEEREHAMISNLYPSVPTVTVATSGETDTLIGVFLIFAGLFCLLFPLVFYWTRHIAKVFAFSLSPLLIVAGVAAIVAGGDKTSTANTQKVEALEEIVKNTYGGEMNTQELLRKVATSPPAPAKIQPVTVRLPEGVYECAIVFTGDTIESLTLLCGKEQKEPYRIGGSNTVAADET